MCGITGILDRQNRSVDRSVLQAMTQSIAHRGPDDEGIFVDGALGFGHRRLAIIDLSEAGRQPMETPEGDLVITYNGEVYNFLELRSELEDLGHVFGSETDTEVVLHAYQEWGPACLDRFNGMFAFAIWNKRTRELLLARDRYGIKPLYHTEVEGRFLFASEIKAFLDDPDFEVELSLPHLREYFTFQNIFSDGTLFAGVTLLPPGHYLRIIPGEEPERVQYWDFDFREEKTAPPEGYVNHLGQLFEQAVKRQLVSDVPVGSYLSGGMDSGSITSVAARQIPYMSTFTGGFDLTSVSGLELAFDERKKAEALSYLCKTEHYEVVLKAGDMERCLDDLVWHLEDPRVGQSYPNHYVARLASKFVKVVLAGTGGDELFGGYPWRYFIGHPGSHDDYVQQYYQYWNRLVPNRVMPDLFQAHVWDAVKDIRTDTTFRDVFPCNDDAPKTPAEYVNHSLYFEAKTFLPGLLLVEDKLSMAHSLESRVPFLDNDLVEFAQHLPVSEKISDLGNTVRLDENSLGEKVAIRHTKTRDGKMLLREAMRTHVPDEVSEQIKQGFSGPDGTWFRGDSIEFVKQMFWNDDARIYEYLRPETVRRMIEEHTEGQQNRRLFIWSLLMLETWLKMFKPRPQTEPMVAPTPTLAPRSASQ